MEDNCKMGETVRKGECPEDMEPRRCVLLLVSLIAVNEYVCVVYIGVLRGGQAKTFLRNSYNINYLSYQQDKYYKICTFLRKICRISQNYPTNVM